MNLFVVCFVVADGGASLLTAGICCTLVLIFFVAIGLVVDV